METTFPSDIGYDSLFIVSVRKNNSQQTQRTGTVIVKRTYTIQSTPGVLTPTAELLPVFMTDQPDNLVNNSDFKADPGVTISQITEGDNHWLRVQGVARGRIVQTLTLEKPLGGRPFTLSLLARGANTNARIEAVQLEAEGSSPLCVINADLTANPSRFTATGRWPAEVTATTLKIVLRMATDAQLSVDYDQIQVEERNSPTEWNPSTILYYEHDLAAFKPEGDLVVLDFTTVANAVTRRVKVNGTTWLERSLTANSLRPKALFGWEPRGVDPRKTQAGTFPDQANQYPLTDPLPADFKNQFYNGYRRTTNPGQNITAYSPFPYLSPAAQIEIQQDNTVIYQLQLPGDSLAATYYAYQGSGADEQTNWHNQAVTLNLDTLVIEPELNRCYLVWRGVWPFDEQPEANYRRLVVTTLNPEENHA
jgi:Uncharacterized protein conserved in bacteria (DUF2169)